MECIFENVRIKNLSYQLNQIQENISDNLINTHDKRILIHAICGAGKTEMVHKLIKSSLELNKVVGFVTPRKTVTIEIKNRFQELTETSLGCWYGESKELRFTQLVFLTSHQLVNFRKQFDLVIFDEVDAFPFSTSFILDKQLENSLRNEKSRLIYLTATPTKKLIKNCKTIFKAYGRYHLKPHPNIILSYQTQNMLCKIINEYDNLLIYVPTINQGEKLRKQLKFPFINSQVESEEIIKDFKNKKYKTIITTILLERGITIESLNVVVLNAEHSVFGHENLIQIAGRVGRKKESSDGKIIFLYKNKSRKLINVKREIETYNERLRRELLK